MNPKTNKLTWLLRSKARSIPEHSTVLQKCDCLNKEGKPNGCPYYYIYYDFQSFRLEKSTKICHPNIGYGYGVTNKKKKYSYCSLSFNDKLVYPFEDKAKINSFFRENPNSLVTFIYIDDYGSFNCYPKCPYSEWKTEKVYFAKVLLLKTHTWI